MTTPTRVLPVDASAPQSAIIGEAAAVLRRGGLVAFPTETVYGLGANALDPGAVARIFAAKGRPHNNPLIVHVADLREAREWTAHWPMVADRLAAAFWPGPLTLVLPRGARVPDKVTAGGLTVAIRIPEHPVALALLSESDLALAAPSANRSSYLSPTRAEHVVRGLGGCIDLVLDAGPTSGGLESTVLDLTSSPPRILRPGLIAPAQIECIIGPIQRMPSPPGAPGAPLRSPGLLFRHYAPGAVLECREADAPERIQALCEEGARVGWLAFSAPERGFDNVTLIVMPAEPTQYAAELYAALHQLDDAGVEKIIVSMPPETDEWLAVRDRLMRASRPPS